MKYVIQNIIDYSSGPYKHLVSITSHS